MPDISPVVLAVVGLVALLIVTGFAVVTRYKVAKPNQAFIITGRKAKGSGDLSGQKVVFGGVFVIPFVQQLSVVDLSSHRIEVNVRDANSAQGIKLNVDAIAIVKVGGDDQSVRLAGQRMNGVADPAAKIEADTTQVLSGVLRGVISKLTVDEIQRDRAMFASQVSEAVEAALTVQGLAMDTFQISDVRDTGTYLTDLGRPEAARVAQAAAIAEAEAQRDAAKRRLAAEQEVLTAEREVALQKARIKAETDAAAATAAAAGPLAAAAKEQEILSARQKVAEEQALLKDKELDTTVRKPADAARYQAVQEAEAVKATRVLEAQAAAETAKLTGVGEREHREQLAAAVKSEGEAQAAAARAIGEAEAAAIDAKAQAMKEFGQAAVLDLLVGVLPQVAKELAAPMAAIDKMTVISTDGASALPKAVANNVSQLTQLFKDTTGFDLTSVLGAFGGEQDTAVKALPAKAEQPGERNGEVVSGATS